MAFCHAGSIPAIGTCYDDCMLISRNLRCDRNNKLIFRNLSFTLRSCKILQVVADNGVGKTSLLRILCGLLSFSDGFINFCFKSFSCNQDKRFMYIGNKQSLYKNLTPFENLSLYLKYIQCNPIVSIEDALKYFDLHMYAHVLCEELSTGQCQKVFLAKLLLVDVNFWFLDEPFIFLDEIGIYRTKKLIFNFIKNCDKRVVITTHYLLKDLLSDSVILYL